ncbi:uncharacterized protein LOC124817125 [Hydra vulgaris]|uniref:uncharacterized protein LOC124817125 n=1 Tax=Hydra vulgaris TaxID=6087 RepID=UPI001F5FA9DE|nr:uncharacterized protein LOC124817125 [Hydra vulgaris]
MAELEDRSRRNNLRINGIDESVNETWEQSEKKVQELLKSKLGFEINFSFERAHRVGMNRSDEKGIGNLSLTDVKPLLGLSSSKSLDILNINDVEIDKANILKHYGDVFFGLCLVKGNYHNALAKNTIPVIHTPRKVLMFVLSKLKSTLHRLVKATVISKISKPSTWAHSMVIIEKKDGSLRLCIELKELNNSVLRQYKTTPSTEEISSKLYGNKVFTVIDMANCYWHIKLDESFSELRTFITPYG